MGQTLLLPLPCVRCAVAAAAAVAADAVAADAVAAAVAAVAAAAAVSVFVETASALPIRPLRLLLRTCLKLKP